MYNAQASFESSGSQGSTRLHLDMADAVNIMTYAAPRADGAPGPGCAAWDIFKARDSARLREFLRKRFADSCCYQGDPIHAQKFYLDKALLRELYRDWGVVSHRIYQRPGEVVFIPAGCAHQVRPCPSTPALCFHLPCAFANRRELTNFVLGLQPGGLHQGRVRLREPGERRAVQRPHARVPRAEPDEGVEGGRPPAAHHDVVRVAFLWSAGEAAPAAC